MPALVWATVAYAGGSLAVLTGQWEIALLGCAMLAWMSARDRAPAATLLCAMAGGLMAAAERGHTAHDVPAYPSGGGDTATAAHTLREQAGRRIDLVFGQDAPLARALLIADAQEIPRELRERYADAGIVHLLCISGMHVGIIAASAVLVLLAVRLPAQVAVAGASAVVMVYVWLLGFPPSALRAGVMVLVATGSRLLQRHTSRWAVLAWGAAVPLARPSTVVEVGYQLSVCGVAALIAADAVRRRTAVDRAGRAPALVLNALVASTLASVVTAPVVAAAFGRVSLISPLANLLADPLLALAQPMLFLALVLSPWIEAARFVAAAAHPLLSGLSGVADNAARIPHAAVDVRLSPVSAGLMELAAAALVLGCVSRHAARPLAVAACAVAAAVWLA